MPTFKFDSKGASLCSPCCKAFGVMVDNGTVRPTHINGNSVAMMFFSDSNSPQGIEEKFEKGQIVLASVCPVCGEKITFQSDAKTKSSYIFSHSIEDPKRIFDGLEYSPKRDAPLPKDIPYSEVIVPRPRKVGFEGIKEDGGDTWVVGAYSNVNRKFGGNCAILPCAKMITAKGWKEGETHLLKVYPCTKTGEFGNPVRVYVKVNESYNGGLHCETDFKVLERAGIACSQTVFIIEDSEEITSSSDVAVYERILHYGKSSSWLMHSSYILKALKFKDEDKIRLHIRYADGDVKSVIGVVQKRTESNSLYVRISDTLAEKVSLTPGYCEVKFEHL